MNILLRAVLPATHNIIPKYLPLLNNDVSNISGIVIVFFHENIYYGKYKKFA